MNNSVKTDVKTGVELIVTADCKITGRSIKSDSPYDLKRMQSIVGGYIEIISTRPEWIRKGCTLAIILNEEGKLIGLPDNAIATYFAVENKMIHPTDYIAGDILFACIDGEDIVPLTEEEANHIIDYVKLLSIR